MARLRALAYSRELTESARTYAGLVSEEDRRRLQLDMLNAEWRRILATVPYYTSLRKESRVPDRFQSLDEYVERVPAVTRSIVREHRDAMTSTERPSEFVRMTGGSTAEPVQLPAWHSEARLTRPDMWLGRSWYGITPSSSLFLLWGHSHLLGTGWRGWLRGRRRAVSDRLLGYRRFSAYDLREEKLHEAGRQIVRHRPEYVLGYGVALDLLSRANRWRRDELRAAGVKLVVGTAESFPSPETPKVLNDLFDCPVAMEYGAVETGVIAHTRPQGDFHVFFRSYFVEAEAEGSNSRRRVRVTSLYPRCFPLVRYDLGDEIEVGTSERRHLIGLTHFDRVVGRCHDTVTLEDGTVVHSELFSHAVRECPEIAGYQVVQSHEGLELHYLSPEPLDDGVIGGIRARLARVHRRLGGIPIRRVPSLEQTVAGKTPMVIRR